MMCPIYEDFAGQRQLRFRVGGKPLHLFKQKGESTHQVYMKVLAYAFYRDRVELQFDPVTNYKVQPALAELDLTGEVRTWVVMGEPSPDSLAYILRHSDAREVCVVMEAPENTDLSLAPNDHLAETVTNLANRLKKQIHYRYTNKKLKLLMFRPLEDFFDPEDVDPHPAFYVFYAF